MRSILIEEGNGMSMMEYVRSKARANQKSIVLPEGTEPRTVQAAARVRDEGLAKRYEGGLSLVFRLCASDYHHYCYIDDGVQGPNHFIEGQLHSVQPIACEQHPIFTLNRRSWCLLDTAHFGPVVQTEIGALIVGGIVNLNGGGPFCRGQEKGYFDLAGSTIVLLMEPERVELLPEFMATLESGQETRVRQGQWIGSRQEGKAKL